MKNETAKFNKGQEVNYLGHKATITKASETPNLNGWFTYSVKYYDNKLRHGQSEVEEHIIKAK